MTPDRRKAACELLAYYVEAGADSVVGEEPVNWFADVATAPHIPLASPLAEESLPSGSDRVRAERREGGADIAGTSDLPPSPTGPHKGGARSGGTAAHNTAAASGVPLSPDAAAMAARAAAKSAASLDELRAILERFEGCALKSTATRLVFADGNPDARVMFVGEAPGYEEDKQGLPFVGRSGQLLDRMMAAIGLDRTSAYIANIVPWRPPGNRTPTPQESSICLPFTLRQIELADPDILVCLGGPSATTLLGITDGILKTRGRWFPYHTGTREIRAIATLHPAYLLRQPLQKRLAWRDFLAIKKALAN